MHLKTRIRRRACYSTPCEFFEGLGETHHVESQVNTKKFVVLGKDALAHPVHDYRALGVLESKQRHCEEKSGSIAGHNEPTFPT